ncbi:diaminopimelate epimerase [Candidatus Woesearchaeota archaeon]|nr:diaminopimelate epimerase [Candidatus Woesearchaeota archaeon]
MQLAFEKYQTNGNDFIIIDERRVLLFSDSDRGRVARVLCNRKTGIGADSVLFLSSSQKADVRMRIFEADESESDMCGNGLCSIGDFIASRSGLSNITVETNVGIYEVSKNEGDLYCIRMGSLQPLHDYINEETLQGGYVYPSIFKTSLLKVPVYILRVGEPHAVLFVHDVEAFPIDSFLKIIQDRVLFPHGININFVQILKQNHIKMRTIERGVWDETLSCGTGATSVAMLYAHLNYMPDAVTIETSSGQTTVSLKEGIAYLAARGAHVFSGTVKLVLPKKLPSLRTYDGKSKTEHGIC